MPQRLKSDAPSRSVAEVGAGDFVKIGSQWKEISSNTAEGATRTPRNWTIRTTDGTSHDMFGVNRYARREDLE
jgi:hypothetical protein